MDDIPEEESVLLMAPTAEAIGRIAGVLLRKSKKEIFEALPQPKRGAIEEDVEYFFNEATHTILGWIAAGHIQNLKDIIPALELARFEDSDEPYFLDDAALNRAISARLETLAYTIRVLLNMEGPAKYLGQLAGQRRESWRDLLVALYDRGMAVRVKEMCALVPALNKSGAAYNAAEKLVEMGLLERQGEENRQRVTYSLSWPGRGVARTLCDLHAGEGGETSGSRDAEEYIKSLCFVSETPEGATPEAPLASGDTGWQDSSASEVDPALVAA